MTISTRDQYLALFPSLSDAIEHENACISIGRDMLPTEAIAVLDDSDAEPPAEEAEPATFEHYLITANGSLMGIYEARSHADALDLYAQDQADCTYDELIETIAEDQAECSEDAKIIVAEIAAEITCRQIDLRVDVSNVVEADDGRVEADVDVHLTNRDAWHGSVTLGRNPGRPTVGRGRKHPIDTCGSPLDYWASQSLHEIILLGGADDLGVIDVITHAVNVAANKI